jgi:hypothetical protein
MIAPSHKYIRVRRPALASSRLRRISWANAFLRAPKSPLRRLLLSSSSLLRSSGVWLSATGAPQKETRLADSRFSPDPQSRYAIGGKGGTETPPYPLTRFELAWFLWIRHLAYEHDDRADHKQRRNDSTGIRGEDVEPGHHRRDIAESGEETQSCHQLDSFGVHAGSKPTIMPHQTSRPCR